VGAIFVHDGETEDYTPGADVALGAVVVQGELVGIAPRPIPSGVLGSLAVAGVFDLPKATGAGTAIGAGVNVYWDVAEAVAKTDAEAGANKHIGKTTRAAADADETVRVRVSQ